MTSTQLDSLKDLFDRDLTRLMEELKLFEDTSDLWVTPGTISNSAGNLILHICGNLQHFIGFVLGQTGYARLRDLEFSSKNVPVDELNEQILATKEAVLLTLEKMSPATLEETYPLEIWQRNLSIGFFLVHLHSHLNYHLGQINYLRRILKAS